MEGWNPLDWTAGPFLMLFATVAGGTLLLLWGARSLLGPDGDGRVAAEMSVLQIGYLAGGAARALDTALVGLFEAGAAVFDKKGDRAVIDGGVVVAPLFALYRGGSREVGRREYHQQNADLGRDLRAELVGLGLAPTDAAVERFQMLAWLALCVPMGLGLAKLLVGLERGRPVGFLICGLIATGVVGGFLACRVPTRSRAGDRVLRQLWAARAARAPLPGELAFAFALRGPAALKGTEYHGFFKQSGDGGGGGGGCGGGGGGGCGGCGS